MVLDNNIITTYSGRKGLLYLQRGGNLKRLCSSGQLRLHEVELFGLIVEPLYFECTQDNKS